MFGSRTALRAAAEGGDRYAIVLDANILSRIIACVSNVFEPAQRYGAMTGITHGNPYCWSATSRPSRIVNTTLCTKVRANTRPS
jgi:hypothetical protein